MDLYKLKNVKGVEGVEEQMNSFEQRTRRDEPNDPIFSFQCPSNFKP